MTLDYGLLLDAVVAGLLVVTIVYATILNRKLSALRDSKAELKKQMIEFQSATDKTETTLAALSDATERAGRPLQELIDEADGKFGDLRIFVDKASGIADRLEAAIGSARAYSPAAQGRGGGVGNNSGPRRPETPSRRSGIGVPVEVPAEDPEAKSVSPAQADLIRALQGVR